MGEETTDRIESVAEWQINIQANPLDVSFLDLYYSIIKTIGGAGETFSVQTFILNPTSEDWAVLDVLKAKIEALPHSSASRVVWFVLEEKGLLCRKASTCGVHIHSSSWGRWVESCWLSHRTVFFSWPFQLYFLPTSTTNPQAMQPCFLIRGADWPRGGASFFQQALLSALDLDLGEDVHIRSSRTFEGVRPLREEYEGLGVSWEAVECSEEHFGFTVRTSGESMARGQLPSSADAIGQPRLLREILSDRVLFYMLDPERMTYRPVSEADWVEQLLGWRHGVEWIV